MAQAKAHAHAGGERPRTRSVRPAAPSYAATLRDSRLLDGASVCDADGHVFLDLVNARGSVLLGWTDRLVEARVRSGGAAAPLEAEAAERLKALIPSAAAAVFRHSAERALADALLAAKITTGRDGAYFCDQAAACAGDRQALARGVEPHADSLAAVVVNPLDVPHDFLAEALRLSRSLGALLIFDERSSAFRTHRGGVQVLTGVTPDLTLLGPSLANGRSIAAVAGAAEPLRALPLAGGRPSTAALAAACATLERVDADDPAQALRVIGAEIAAEVEARFLACGAGELFEIGGDPVWTVVAAKPRPDVDAASLEAALGRELWSQGVLSFGAHVPSFATGEGEVERLLRAYDAVLPGLALRAVSGAFDRRPRRRVS